MEDTVPGNPTDAQTAAPRGTDDVVYPPTWETMPSQDVEGVRGYPVELTSQEGRQVAHHFYQRSLADWLTPVFRSFEITHIVRVQNPRLWESFYRRRQLMSEERGGGEVEERRLFHGTMTTNVDSICSRGFDLGRCGINGSIYGRGLYLTPDMTYANSFVSCCSKYQCPSIVRSVRQDTAAPLLGDEEDPLRDPRRWWYRVFHRRAGYGPYMFLCDVLTGLSTEGRREYTLPPPLPPTAANTTNDHTNDHTNDDNTNSPLLDGGRGGQLHQRRYDSCYNHNLLTDSRVHVVFRADQAYPNYVVEYRDHMNVMVLVLVFAVMFACVLYRKTYVW